MAERERRDGGVSGKHRLANTPIQDEANATMLYVFASGLNRRNVMHFTRLRTLKLALVAGAALAVFPVFAAEVTPARLTNPEPQNWLMNHRMYDGQRFSPLAHITKNNVKHLKLAFAVPL